MTKSVQEMTDAEYRAAKNAISGRVYDRRYVQPAAPTPESELARAARNFGVLQPTVLQEADLAAVRAGPNLARSATAEIHRLREKYPGAFAVDARSLPPAEYASAKAGMKR